MKLKSLALALSLFTAVEITRGNPEPPLPDYYNGIVPYLEIVSTTRQMFYTSNHLVMALTVEVSHGTNGVPLADAPVFMSVTNGTMKVSNLTNGTLSTDWLMHTDTNGLVRSWLFVPDTNANYMTITATSGANSRRIVLKVQATGAGGTNYSVLHSTNDPPWLIFPAAKIVWLNFNDMEHKPSSQSAGGGNPIDYGTNTFVSAMIVRSNLVHLSLSNALPDTAYDVYFTTALEPGFYWRLHFRGATNQTEFDVTKPPTSRGFFTIASAADSDEDGISDGFEILVAKTDPANPDSDSSGVLDGYKDFDGDGALNFEEFNLRTDPYNADSNQHEVSDGRYGGNDFLSDGIDNNKNGSIDESAEGDIASGPYWFAGELKLRKLRGDNQVGITNTQLLLPFVVYLTNTNGIPVTNGSSVTFSAFSPSGGNISSLLSQTTAYTGSNGFAGQAQAYLTLTNQTGRYRVLAVWNGITNEFSAETVTPLSNYVANARYEPLENGEIIINICHTLFYASGGNTNISHVVGVKLTSDSNPAGIISALYETYPGSGIYVGSCKTEALQSSGAQARAITDWGGPDSATEYASADNAEAGGSSFSDSAQFDSTFSGWGCVSRGSARSPGTNTYPFTVTFLQGAGFQSSTNSVLGIPIFWLIKNQADFFYISTHGLHAQNIIYTAGQTPVTPGILAGQWKDDLDIVIIAGCSVLDVTGDKWPADNNRPGKEWAKLGPKYFLGYEGSAPSDSSGVPVSILQDFASRWENVWDFDDPTDAWMQANGPGAHAWNACALDCTRSPKRAWYWHHVFGSLYQLRRKDEPW